MTVEQIKKLSEKWENSPRNMRDKHMKHKRMTPDSWADLVRYMEDRGQVLLETAEYLAHRSGVGTCGDRRNDEDAANAAKKQYVKIRKAMGYTYPGR